MDYEKFIDYLKDFTETEYPELADWANRIKAMDPMLEDSGADAA